MAQRQAATADTSVAGKATRQHRQRRNHALLPPESLWILGAGHFGQLAARRLARRYPHAALVIVDHRASKLGELEGALRRASLCEDGIDFLCRQEIPVNQWIIPAIPVHVAWLWLLRRLAASGRPVDPVPVPDTVDPVVPHPYRVPTGTLYASHAAFRCPDGCNEPEHICPVTRQPRPGELDTTLAALDIPGWRVEVIQSWQLLPGVGGYQGAQLQATLQRVQAQPGRFLIATSCRCHAVIDGLACAATDPAAGNG
jgi:hypothetical protein